MTQNKEITTDVNKFDYSLAINYFSIKRNTNYEEVSFTFFALATVLFLAVLMCVCLCLYESQRRIYAETCLLCLSDGTSGSDMISH